MIKAPSCLVVFVHGIWMLADEEPLARSRNVGAVARVTWYRGLNAVAFLTVVSPDKGENTESE